MKITVNKSAKRVLSIALALVMLVGTLFTANIGVNISADAETAPIAEGTIDLLEFGNYLTEMGSTSTYYDTKLADNGETGADWENAIIIDSAEEFVYLSKQGGGGAATAGKYYKVADGIAGFDLSAGNLDFDGTLADNLEKIKNGGKNHAGVDPGFQGNFDANGATVYGAVINGSTYAGLFTYTDGDVTIKNLNVKFGYFKASTAAAAIIGHHNHSTMCTVTVENCSVTDCYIETTGTGYGTAAGAVIGYGASAPSYTDENGATVYVNVAYNIKNCFVNLDEDYFVSPGEDGTEASGERVCHGGVMGAAGSNALAVSDCIVLGVTPYATTECTTQNDVQHSGLEGRFTNVYTDQPTGKIAIGGKTLGVRDFTNRVYQLTAEQMQGSAAVANMNLPWFSVWKPGAEGEYPTFVKPGEEQGVSFWTGSAASGFASGTGTKDDPFIIETVDQLYYALTNITYTTATSGDLAVETAESVAGGTQTDRIFKQGSTTVYQPVYTPYYYKVADGVEAFYLNNIYGNETLAGAKAMAAGSTKKDWKPGKSFVGHLDGNGVTIYGMYSSTGQGLVYKLDGSATVKNFNFDSCYATGSGNVALLTTNLGSYNNDSTIVNVANISVRNSYIATTRNITLTARTDTSGCYDHNPGPAGIISTGSTCENVTVSNCLYDGYTCERAIGASSEANINMMGSIYSGTSSANNFVLDGCISFGAPAVNEVNVNNKEAFYNRYDKNQGFQVFFYNTYTDIAHTITTTYPNKYDKLSEITVIEEKDTYEMYDFPKLSWTNWELVTVDDGRTIPMPVANKSTSDELGSFANRLAKDSNEHASTGPYKHGAASNPTVYALEGSGTEADPFLIKTDIELARAIATGGMNITIPLYYKLANDIDLSSGHWIQQAEIAQGGVYYTYKAFGGTLDGDGHTITGLSAGDSVSAGLIPVLDGGTVKNLHVRDASVVSGEYAGVIVGKMITGNIIDCSIENFDVSSKNATKSIVGYDTDDCDGEGILYSWDPAGDGITKGEISNVYAIDGDDYFYRVVLDDDTGEVCHYGTATLVDEYDEDISTWDIDTSAWYIGGAEGSLPRLKSHAAAMKNVDIVGDGKADDYSSADLTALKNKLLRKPAYANVYGDVSRNGIINVADLAVLQRIIGEDYGSELSDGFWANVEKGTVDIYYGENDNYDAARKIELYLESVCPDVDVEKHVSTSKGTVSGVNSDSSKVYLHANDTAASPDGKLDIIVGNLDNVNAYKANTVATAANTYAVTYDSANQVIWLQGANFTAVEQATLDFIAGSDYTSSTVFTCGSTELATEKKPITVKLDTNYDGTLDTDKTLYYAWGDEFNGEELNTKNWVHNSQQSEAQQGKDTVYYNQEVAPVKDYDKMLVVDGGKLSMKRGYDSKLGTSTNGTVALDVTPGEFNGYKDSEGFDAIDTDGSDKYFSSGKITTSQGMLYKQGYIEFMGQLPADGHAFPAWWLMGRPAQAAHNKGYDDSLYGKVYKLNPNWNGENAWDESNIDTFKYQIPTAIYEIDMIEVMQHPTRYGTKYESTGIFGDGSGSYHDDNATKNWTKAVGWYMINSTIHKWYTSGVDNQDTPDTNDDRLWIHDWDNYKAVGGYTNSNFASTSGADSWIHNIGSTQLDFGTSTSEGGSWFTGYNYYDGSIVTSARDDLQAKRKYGFSWNTDGTSGFEATLYVYNTDGTLKKTVPIASGVSGLNVFKDSNKKTEANGALGTNASIYSDAKVFNQYMYILFDNKFYSANNISGSPIQFTDLLTAAGLTSLEIDYVRVYQEDNFRDIVTPETENFNNNNHFGYN